MGFNDAFEKTIGMEGGFSNHSKDRGGRTIYGISEKTYPHLFKDGKLPTLEQAKNIYLSDFWIKLHLDEINNEQIAEEIFDTAVNMGQSNAIRIVQRSINFLGNDVKVDGIIGSRTIESVNFWCKKDPEAFFKCLNGFQFMRYVEIVTNDSSQEVFSRGWMKRINYYQKGDFSFTLHV